ncbi:MAG: helix-turn-helix domain-containing protein [Nitrososphaerota archaeon]
MADLQRDCSFRGDAGAVCPVVAASKLLKSVWSLVVITYLLDDTKSFNELLRAIRVINSKTLSRTLKSLQAAGLVRREVISVQPFAVRYSLTEMGIDLAPLLEYLRSWGEKWVIGQSEVRGVQSGLNGVKPGFKKVKDELRKL